MEVFEKAVMEKYEHTPIKKKHYWECVRLIDLWNDFKQSDAYMRLLWKEMKKIRKKDFNKWAEIRFQSVHTVSNGILLNYIQLKNTEPAPENAPEPVNIFEKVMMDMYEKQDANEPVRLKQMWEEYIQSEMYKTLTYKGKRKYSRDAFYRWVSSICPVTDDKKGGKFVKGLRRKTI
jgi:hypothetical protein